MHFSMEHAVYMYMLHMRVMYNGWLYIYLCTLYIRIIYIHVYMYIHVRIIYMYMYIHVRTYVPCHWGRGDQRQTHTHEPWSQTQQHPGIQIHIIQIIYSNRYIHVHVHVCKYMYISVCNYMYIYTSLWHLKEYLMFLLLSDLVICPTINQYTHTHTHTHTHTVFSAHIQWCDSLFFCKKLI